MRHLPADLPVRGSTKTDRTGSRRARRERGRCHGRARSTDSAVTSGCLGAGSRSRAPEKPRRAADAAHRPVARRAARCLFPTDGPAPRVHPGRRGNHALGCGQRFPENPRGAAGVGHPNPHGSFTLRASAHDCFALPAVPFRAARADCCGKNSQGKNRSQARGHQARGPVGRRQPWLGDRNGRHRGRTEPQECPPHPRTSGSRSRLRPPVRRHFGSRQGPGILL